MTDLSAGASRLADAAFASDTSPPNHHLVVAAAHAADGISLAIIVGSYGGFISAAATTASFVWFMIQICRFVWKTRRACQRVARVRVQRDD